MDERLLVIDGAAHLYQVFYAIRGLTAPDGEPVNAIYGFARMLHRLRRDYNPTHMAVAWDPEGEVFRHEMYEDYKANREPMPDDMARQIPLLKELLDAQDVPLVTVEGYEADDVMGTLARRASEEDIECILVTTDKDAEQLIDERVKILHLHKDREELLDRDALEEEKGVKPSQVIDMMSLSGDNSDNIPGIRGIGPKTALKLIRQFGTVENLYENLDEVGGDKRREKLRENRDQVKLARKLVTIDREVPLETDLEELRLGDEDTEELLRLYESLGFRSLAEKVGGQEAAAQSRGRQQGSLFGGGDGDQQQEEEKLASLDLEKADYSAARTPEEILELSETLREEGRFAVDVETTSLDIRQAEVVGLSFSWETGQGVYVPVDGPEGEKHAEPEEALQHLRPVLQDASLEKVGQNLKYDAAVLANCGVDLRGIWCDTMVAAYLLHPARRSYGLDALAERHLGYRTRSYEEVTGNGAHQRRMDEVPVDDVTPYACEDTDIALRLADVLCPELQEEGLWQLFRRLEMPLVRILARMEWDGIRIDTEHLASISREFEGQIQDLQEKIYEAAGEEFNINSPSQLSDVLFEKLDLPAPSNKKRETGYSTEASVLEDLQDEHPIAEHVLKYRELSKLKSTYTDALQDMIDPDTGRLHAAFNQTATATGRLSSSEPNLQNIPVRTRLGRRIRSCFVPREEDMSFLSADYSQVELRLLAHCAGDERLTQAFRDGRDIHTVVTAETHDVPEEDVTSEMRQRGKAVNFGIIYGQKAYGLSQQLDVSVDEARRFIESYFERYPGVREFIGETVDSGRKKGYVTTIWGRRRYVPGLRGSGSVRSAAERVAVNTVIQGSAADLIKQAMIDVAAELEGMERTRMLMQIHDELVFETPDDTLDELSELVQDRMSGAMDLSVPLDVDIAAGKNWEDAK